MNVDEAKNKELGVLSRKRLAKKELYEKLIRAGAGEEIAKAVLTWAEEDGFVNDFEYAKSYISDASNLKKHGMKKIRFDLSRKGISEFLIDDVCFELGEYDETENIKSIIEKKLLDVNDKKQTDKVIRFLVSRGYSFSDIKKCINDYVSDIQFGDDEFDS